VVVDAVKKPTRPLAGVNAVVCLKQEKGRKKLSGKPQKGLDRADIVRDYRLCDFPGVGQSGWQTGLEWSFETKPFFSQGVYCGVAPCAVIADVPTIRNS
jgi:hypothetical protein